MFSYKPLLRLLVEKDMTKTQLREVTGMSMNTLAKISKNEYVSMSTLDSICKYFHCKIEDIIEFIEWFILCHLTHDWSHECAVTPQSNNITFLSSANLLTISKNSNLNFSSIT